MSGGSVNGSTLTSALESALNSLHHAAVAFNNPDPAVRGRGEAVFLELRQSPDALELVLYALNHSRDAFVHFQCLSVLLIRLPLLTLHAPSKGLASLHDLRNFLLTLIGRHLNGTQEDAWWPQYTRARACQAFAAVQIRLMGLVLEHERHQGGVERAIEEQCQLILEHVVNLDGLRTHASLLLTAALLSEFAILHHDKEQAGGRGKRAVKTSQIQDRTGLSSLQQRWVRAWMQERLLNVIISRVLHHISELYTKLHTPDDFIALTTSVNLLEKLLRWQPLLVEPWAGLQHDIAFDDIQRLLERDTYTAYDDTDYAGDDVASAGAAAQKNIRVLPDSIAGTYLNVDIISLLIATYRFIDGQGRSSMRELAMCKRKLRDCLLLVFSFSDAHGIAGKSIAGRRGLIFDSLTSLQADLRQSILSMPLLGDRADALFFHTQALRVLLAATDTSRISEAPRVMEILADLTVPILEFAFEKRQDSDEEEEVTPLIDELVQHLLACWSSLILLAEHDRSVLAAVQQHIFPRIVQPYIDGRMQLAVHAASDEDADESEIGEEKVSDYESYDETLTFLAMLARKGNFAQSVSHLQAIATSTMNGLAEYYRSSAQGQLGHVDVKTIEGRWESLHWLYLITGHILADQSKGELPSTPQECTHLDHTAQNELVHVIDSLGLTMLQILAEAPTSKMQSPQVVQSALWFNARWVPSYLLARTPQNLSSAYDGEAGLHRLEALLTNADRLVATWQSDADVIAQVAALLRSLSISEGIMKTLLSLPAFGNMVKRVIEGLGVFPASTHKSLIAALVGCIYASDGSLSPETYFGQITEAVADRLSAIVNNPQFGTTAFSQSAETIERLLAALDMLDGIAASTQPKSARAVYDFLSRFFDTLISLTQLYKERSEVYMAIVRVLRTLTGALDLGFGVPEDIVQGLNSIIYKLFAADLSVTTLVGDSVNLAMEEDSPFESLCLLIDLLDDLLLASDGDEGDPLSEWLAPLSNLRTGDVCMFAFSRLAPLLSGEVLAVPAVRSRFAHLTSQIFVLFSHRLAGLALQEGMHHTNPAAGHGGQCVRLHATCIQALAATLQFDESKAIADSLEAVNALASATRRLVSSVVQHAAAPQGRLEGGEIVIAPLMSPLLDSIVRALLLEPLAPSTMDWFVQTMRKLIDTIVTTKIQWSGHVDGRARLHVHLEHLCATTTLRPLRAHQVPTQGAHGISDDVARRHAFANIVSQLVQACIGTLSSEGDLKQFGDLARQIAWNGRTQLQIR